MTFILDLFWFFLFRIRIQISSIRIEYAHYKLAIFNPFFWFLFFLIVKSNEKNIFPHESIRYWYRSIDFYRRLMIHFNNKTNKIWSKSCTFDLKWQSKSHSCFLSLFLSHFHPKNTKTNFLLLQISVILWRWPPISHSHRFLT